MADFKDYLSPETVARIGAELTDAAERIRAASAGQEGNLSDRNSGDSRYAGAFDPERFRSRATEGLDALELMARVDWIARALAHALPPRPEDADRLIREALAAGGLHGWASMPVNAYVAMAMLDRPDIGLPLLAALTHRFSAEFAIRPFIEAQYEASLRHLRAWTAHPDEHVRRLVSEGTRPRLPWGRRLARFVDDPTPAVELLDALVDDTSPYVRKSVANHLNDISKDHPALALEIAGRWSRHAAHGESVARHGLRTLVKRGDPAALAILGFDSDARVELVALSCSPSAVPIGEAVLLDFALRAVEPTRAVIDYVVHYQGARGPKPGKVFKLAVRDLPAGEEVRISRKHRFEHVSIRTIRPGPHRIEVQVNGRVLGATEVEVSEASGAG